MLKLLRQKFLHNFASYRFVNLFIGVVVFLSMIAEILHVLRVIFGLFFLFFVPGYAFTLVLFPRKDELSLIERIGFAGALSIVLDILITLFIDLVLHVPTTALNIFVSLLFFTAICLGIWKVEMYLISKYPHKFRKEEKRKVREMPEMTLKDAQLSAEMVKERIYKPADPNISDDDLIEFIKKKKKEEWKRKV